MSITSINNSATALLQKQIEQMAEAGFILGALFFVMLIACMLIYDAALDALEALYRKHLRPKLKFLN